MSFCQILGPKDKALQINLDQKIYGSFAEIGAGQEVARFFFQAGGAAGTIAKSISTYDMAISDIVYGKADRYVCETRVDQMLGHEFDQLVERLGKTRGQNTQFFAYADTVEAKAFKGNRDCHGWMGIRFQHLPEAPPSDVIIHVRMHDKQNIQQQEAIGIMGVNLIYAAFYHNQSPKQFIASMMEQMSSDRIEVDAINLSGPAFSHVDFDSRIMSLEMVKRNYTKAVLFDKTGKVLRPHDVFYKKNICLLRGSFRPITHLNLDMMKSGLNAFTKDLDNSEHKNILTVAEISTNQLTERSGEVDTQDFLARVDLISSYGHNVLITNYAGTDELSNYLHSVTSKSLGLITGIYGLEDLFTDKDDTHDDIFSLLGRIVSTRSKFYVYPTKKVGNSQIITSRNAEISHANLALLEYLFSKNMIKDIADYNGDYVTIWNKQVLNLLQSGDSKWEEDVPAEIVKLIKEQNLFGYKS